MTYEGQYGNPYSDLTHPS